MASVRESILAAAKTALEGAGGPTGLTVHRRRTRPINLDNLPAIVVYVLRENVQVIDQDDPAERVMTLRAECRQKGASTTPTVAGDDPDTLLDPLLTWAVSTLLTDSTLEALVLDIEERQTLWEAEELDQVYAAAAVDFEITYLTAATDPESAA